MAKRLTFDWPAGEHERFAAGAFDGVLGPTIFVDETGRSRPARLVDATVADDGRSVALTIELDGQEPADG